MAGPKSRHRTRRIDRACAQRWPAGFFPACAISVRRWNRLMEIDPGLKQIPLPESQPLSRRRLHRGIFVAAGCYNIGWGIFSALDPQWLFRFAKMPLANHPQIFACLGMVVGLYGILYLEVARVPERGWLPAAVGFIGKFLGPIGLFVLLWQGVCRPPPSSCALPMT